MSGNVSISRRWVLDPVTLHVGSAYRLSHGFEVHVQHNTAVGHSLVNFGDPDIDNIEITDPATGKLLTGVTMIGASGHVYPVNAIPEPSSGWLMVVVLGFAYIAKKRRGIQIHMA